MQLFIFYSVKMCLFRSLLSSSGALLWLSRSYSAQALHQYYDEIQLEFCCWTVYFSEGFKTACEDRADLLVYQINQSVKSQVHTYISKRNR